MHDAVKQVLWTSNTLHSLQLEKVYATVLDYLAIIHAPSTLSTLQACVTTML